jgi:Mrp family chromosome partitioning ATPase/capsular polysaccharide biosynthesis protein
MSTDLSPNDTSSADSALWPLLAAVRRRWWLVVLVVAVCGIAAALVAGRRAPSYTAQAQILAKPFSGDESTLFGVRLLQNSGDPTRDVETAITLLANQATETTTARRLGDGTTQADVHDRIALSAIGGGNVIGVDATADSPEGAVRLADTYARAAIDARNALVAQDARAAIAQIDGRNEAALVGPRQQLRTLRDKGDPTLLFSQQAATPEGQDGPAGWLVVLAAVIAGGLLAAVGALLLERVDRRVRDRAGRLRRVPVPVLTAVPSPRGRHGIDMPPAVREAFRTLQIQLDLRRTTGCRRILVTSPSSGDGKTTAVLNLAFALVSAGHRVIVIDFDLRKPDVAHQLDVVEPTGVATTIATGQPLTEIMRAAPRLPPLRVVQVSSGPGDVALLPTLTRRMEVVLAEAAPLADYVLLDTSPLGEVSDALPLLELVDDVLLVGRPGRTDGRSLDAMAGLFDRSDVVPAGWVVMGAETMVSTYYEDPVRTRNEGLRGTLRRLRTGTR